MSKTPKPIKVLVVLPVLGQPRHAKRVEMLKEAGFDVTVAAFERDYHKGRLPDAPIIRLGKVGHGRFVSRLLRFLASMPRLRSAIVKHDLVYAAGIDSSLLAVLAGSLSGARHVVEVGDVHRMQTAGGWKGRLVRLLDRALMRRVRLLVVTAEGFAREYYRGWLGSSVETLVLENKLERGFVESLSEGARSTRPDGVPLRDRPLRIGYFGLLRCPWTWSALKSAAEGQEGRIEVIAAGFPMNPADLPQQAESIAGVHYLGEYKSPDDLERLYTSVDVIWACYAPIRAEDWNLRWARPNRFYEACCFRRPLISRDGSCDAIEVASYGIGLVISETDPAKVAARLRTLTAEEVASWTSAASRLPPSIYMYTDEVERLRGALIRATC
jgi:succinoglycan biosynthesis protein ExoL